MDFSLSPQQEELRASVLAFAREQLQDDFRKREKSETFFRDGWERCAAFGLTGLPVAEQHGGRGLDIVSCMIAMQALAYGCPDSGLLFALCSHMWTSEVPLMLFGSEAQKEQFLPRMAKGELIGCHAMTEPESVDFAGRHFDQAEPAVAPKGGGDLFETVVVQSAAARRPGTAAAVAAGVPPRRGGGAAALWDR